MKYIIGHRTYERIAWTGGDRPFDTGLSYAQGQAFIRIRCRMYREQLADFGGMPDRDTRYILWNRATHDAWRTVTRG